MKPHLFSGEDRDLTIPGSATSIVVRTYIIGISP